MDDWLAMVAYAEREEAMVGFGGYNVANGADTKVL